jgi:hypothetical protein
MTLSLKRPLDASARRPYLNRYVNFLSLISAHTTLNDVKANALMEARSWSRGTATVSVASGRRPADWLQAHGTEAFGETPKAAGEDARAPQSSSITS